MTCEFSQCLRRFNRRSVCGFRKLEPKGGIEPPTHALRMRCSTPELLRHFCRQECRRGVESSREWVSVNCVQSIAKCDFLEIFLKECHARRFHGNLGERMQKDDRQLFIDQVREHHATLRGFVRSLGVAPMWVDDVAQEAFIVAYNRLDEFDKERDFGAWLRGIARNLVINERRKDARRKRILSDNLTDVLLASSSASDHEEEGLGDRGLAKLNALRECIKGLPEKSLSLLKSRYENESSAQDIAEEFSMNPPAVRKALERSRTALKKCMEERLGAASELNGGLCEA